MEPIILDNIVLQEVLDAIEDRYGDLDNETGCYINTDYGHRWLSISEIVDIIQRVDRRFE